MRSRLSSRSSTLLLIWLSSLLMVSSSSTFTADKLYQKGLLRTNQLTFNATVYQTKTGIVSMICNPAAPFVKPQNEILKYVEFYWSAGNEIPVWIFQAVKEWSFNAFWLNIKTDGSIRQGNRDTYLFWKPSGCSWKKRTGCFLFADCFQWSG